MLITLDTTRADHLGLYGYFRDTSPRLDAFAQEAIVFDRLIVPMATTLPTHLSILTGTFPLEHGVTANATQGGELFVPSPLLDSLASRALDLGWATGAFVSAAPLKRRSGVGVGFEVHDEPRKKAKRDGRQTTDAALAWLRTIDEDQPYLLWVHYFDAHRPLEHPDEYNVFTTDEALEEHLAERDIPRSAPRPLVEGVELSRPSFNLYDGGLRYQDHLVGELLDQLKKRPDWDRTAVVIVGDHGEGLCQHDEAAHGGTWDEQLHAPLLMRVPGQAPRRVTPALSAVDVLPTLLGLVGAHGFEEFLAAASGLDVLSPDHDQRPIFSMDSGRLLGRDLDQTEDYRFALTWLHWKYIRIHHLKDDTVSHRLFDLRTDPFELQDQAAENEEVVGRMSRWLGEELARQRTRAAAWSQGDGPQTREADPEFLEELRGLGYLIGDPPRERDG